VSRGLAAVRAAPYDGRVMLLPDRLGAIADAVAVFRRHRVPYALIGGLAVGIRSGVPRATLDVDFGVATTVSRRAMATWFEAAKLRGTGEFRHSLHFEHVSGEPVQLAFDPGFDAMIERAQMIAFGDLEICVVTTSDLMAMKRRAASDPDRRRSRALRDQADIAVLEGDVPAADEGW